MDSVPRLGLGGPCGVGLEGLVGVLFLLVRTGSRSGRETVYGFRPLAALPLPLFGPVVSSGIDVLLLLRDLDLDRRAGIVKMPAREMVLNVDRLCDYRKNGSVRNDTVGVSEGTHPRSRSGLA